MWLRNQLLFQQSMAKKLGNQLTSYFFTLNENIEVIGHDAFEECENLQEVIGGVHVKTIFQSAFSRCENLIKVDVGNEINRIYHEAFYCCTNLKTIGEQKQLIYVEPDAFEKSGMESMIEMY